MVSNATLKNEQIIADKIAAQKGHDHVKQKGLDHAVGSAQNADGKTLTKFANNTYQYAVPGQTEVLNLDSIIAMEKLEELGWPMPAIVSNEILKNELEIANMVAQKNNKPQKINHEVDNKGRVLTKFANNTYQHAYPGQTEVLNMQSIQIVEELEK